MENKIYTGEIAEELNLILFNSFESYDFNIELRQSVLISDLQTLDI